MDNTQNDDKIAMELQQKIGESFRPIARRAIEPKIVERGQKLLIDYQRSMPVMIDITKIIACFDTSPVKPVSCTWQDSLDGDGIPGIVFDGVFGGRQVMVTFVMNDYE